LIVRLVRIPGSLQRAHEFLRQQRFRRGKNQRLENLFQRHVRRKGLHVLGPAQFDFPKNLRLLQPQCFSRTNSSSARNVTTTSVRDAASANSS